MTKDKQSASPSSHDKGDDSDKDRAPSADPAAAKAGGTRADKTEVQPDPVPDQSAAGSSEQSGRPEVSRPKRRRFIGTVAVLALLLALGGIGAGYWAWLQIDRRLAVTTEGNNKLSSAVSALEQSRDVQSLRADLGEFEAKSAAMDRKLGAQQQAQAQLRQTLTNVQEVVGNNQRDWMLAEAEYLMRMAQYRLRLARDVPSAIAALEAADRRLAQIGDPLLIPVREALTEEISTLETWPRPDRVGVALELEQIIVNLDSPAAAMPVAEDGALQPVADTAGGEGGWQSFVDRIWMALSQHITVRSHDRPLSGLPSAESQVYARQMLRLRLEAARLAALAQDAREYHRQLDLARQWISAHYPGETGKQLTKKLAALDAVEIHPELPEIGQALVELRNYENRTGKEG